MITRTIFFLTITVTSLMASDAAYDSLFEKSVKMGEHAPLDAVGENLREVNVLRATFTQEKRLKVLRRPLLSSGTFLFAAEYGIFWKTDKPFTNIFMLTPDAIFQQSEGSEPIAVDTASKPALAGFTAVFLSLFSGDGVVLQDTFDLFFEGDSNGWNLGLKPKGTVMRKVIDRLVLRGGETVQQLEIFEANGDHSLIRFDQIDTTEPLGDDERAQFDR